MFDAQEYVAELDGLSARQNAVLQVIALRLNKDTLTAWPSREYISLKSGVSVRRVTTVVSELEQITDNGYPLLTVERARNKGQLKNEANVYRLTSWQHQWQKQKRARKETTPRTADNGNEWMKAKSWRPQ